MQLAQKNLAEANRIVGANITVGAMLLDQEQLSVGFDWNASTRQVNLFWLALLKQHGRFQRRPARWAASLTSAALLQYTQRCKGPCAKAVNHWNEAVVNATEDMFPGIAIDAYKRGEISRATGDMTTAAACTHPANSPLMIGCRLAGVCQLRCCDVSRLGELRGRRVVRARRWLGQ